MAIPGVCKLSKSLPARLSWTSAFLDGGKQLLNLSIQPGKIQLQHRFPGMQHNIHRPIYDSEMVCNSSTHSALYTVADHSSSHCLSHRKSNPRPGSVRQRSHAIQRSDIAGKAFPGFFIYALKIRMLQQTRAPGKSCDALWRNLVCSQLQPSGEENYSRKPGFTETRLRPLARRRERTARPLLVFIRVRKPCVLDRRRRLG
jgi:hypothetical protein